MTQMKNQGNWPIKQKPAGKVVIILVLAVLIAASIIFGNTTASSSKFHSKRIAYLEEKRTNAKALIGGASVTAFLISMIPDDTATPNANQIANIGKDFLIILSALTAEQYMLTITGYLSFCWIIPIALVLLILYNWSGGRHWGQMAIKLLVFGIALYYAVPISIKVSGLIEDTYQETVNSTLQASQELKDDFHYVETSETETEVTAEMETEPDKTWLASVTDTIAGAGEAVGDAVGSAAEGAKNAFGSAVDFIEKVPGLPKKAADLANRYVDAFVIMLVTTCIIPVLTLLATVWMINLILGTDLKIGKGILVPKKCDDK